jgi:hypothetical protein
LTSPRMDPPWTVPACIAGAAAVIVATGMFVAASDAVPMASRAALLILAAVMPLLVMPMPTRRIALYLVLGGFAGATVYVFAVGPGNLWPIAILYIGVTGAVPIAIGSVAGFLLRRIATPST